MFIKAHMKKQIAVFGNPGSYHHQVATEVYGTEANCTFCTQFADVITQVVQENCTGILAIENSLLGEIARNQQLLAESGLSIISMYDLPIEHYLITATPQNITNLTEVHSHPAALAQSGQWLSLHPQLTAKPASDTAGAVKTICEANNPHQAAIASQYAANYYGGSTVAKIATHQPNITTFAIISQKGT